MCLKGRRIESEMANPKRIPYASGGFIDEATMRISKCIHLLEPLVELKATAEERITVPVRVALEQERILAVMSKLRSLVERGGNERRTQPR